MKRTALALLSCLAVSAASSAVPAGGGSLTRSTTKATAQFAACFAGVQTQAAQPWSFVPRDSGGGTFSNFGAKGVSSPYFLRIADRGAMREIRLEASNAASGAPVLRAVDRCV